MIEFCLQNIYDGWQSVRSPDNIEFTVRMSERRSFDVFASIVELVELYEKVRAKEECNMMIGTGNIIQIKTADEGVILRFDERYETSTTFDNLESSIEQLLQNLFFQLPDDLSLIPESEREAYPFVEDVYQNVTSEN